MNKDEFEQSYKLIKELYSESDAKKPEIVESLKRLDNSMNNLLESIDKRNACFNEYISLLSEFDYANNITSALDLFPGIRTASEMADPEELKAKSEKMKTAATQIDSLTKIIDSESSSVMLSLKRMFSLVSEYILGQNNVYDNSLDLLSKMDSIYDVGNLSNKN